jgi:hypothetical protein
MSFPLEMAVMCVRLTNKDITVKESISCSPSCRLRALLLRFFPQDNTGH